MVNITHKVSSLRKAIAQAEVKVSKQQTIEAIEKRLVPKGDVFEFSRAAGLLAVKKTSDVIPDCHPLPVEFTAIRHTIEGLTIFIEVEVHAIYRTGVEVEAMHGAAVTALTMYDMLKPIDKNIQIENIRLLEKKGGKSQYNDQPRQQLKCGVVVCSDTIAAGTNQDTSGKMIVQKLEQHGVVATSFSIIPDDFDTIQQKITALSTDGFDLVIFTGGTGLSKRDVTPDAIEPLITRNIPGIMEAARHYGQERTPFAMLSRGVSGFVNNTLVLTLPGSARGVEETMDALFPYVIHIFQVADGLRHTTG